MKVFALAALIAAPYCLPAQPLNVPWNGYAHDPQHTGTSAAAAQPMVVKHWQTRMDLNPPGGGSGPLFVHYGSPVITAGNTILVPTTAADGSYQLRAFQGSNGAALYTLSSDYTVPSNTAWIPPFGPALALGTRVYYPGAGGTVYYRDLPNSVTGPNGQSGATGQIAFYGMAGASGYTANQSAFNRSVSISTPLTADRFGNIYFGFIAAAGNPAGLVSGIARITPAGKGSWASAVSLTGDEAARQIAQNCAPALNNSQTVVYVATSTGQAFGTGYVASLDATTLAPISHIDLHDPRGPRATVSLNSTAAPMIGPDGDVYFGVLESPCCSSHRDRGWLLHFDGALSQQKIPGSFGWDDTPSIVPSSIVPSYTGTSSYLLLTKYNNYETTGGDGINQIALIDPFASQRDLYGTSVTVMKEVIAINGVTPEDSGLPAVREWCINAAAVDPFTKSAIVNSEDGVVYRWDFTTNTLSQHVTLTSGRGEAYTPTIIGPDGTVYAINDSILFAVGN
ncbi:MAG TPA: hypothetical protein VHC72_19110 [Bryobacteraceae bacterium]|nr:hypothetical protein [Bryobacteraceae bacterium]